MTEAYEKLASSQRVRYLTHVVGKREQLATIAAAYRIPAADIKAANPKQGSKPRAGARLVVPTVAIPSALAIRAVGERRPHHSATPAPTGCGAARRWAASRFGTGCRSRRSAGSTPFATSTR